MLTVMMATYNGALTLPIVLDAYRYLDMPDGGWQLIVVDNGSTDDTSKILDSYKSSLPMTQLFVPEAGKNNALNAGLARREGDLVVFTDDDAVPASDWLCQMRNAADEHTEFDIFGGAIRPRWEREPEQWILDWVPKGISYAITDEALADGPVPYASVWGPNMAVRGQLFDDGNFFAGDIGPTRHSNYVMGSETEFSYRMEKRGHRAWFVSSAVVEHIIREYQLERPWILARAFRYGRGLLHKNKLKGETPPKTVFGIPRYQIRMIFVGLVKLVVAKAKGDAEEAFQESWNLRCSCGYVCESRRNLGR